MAFNSSAFPAFLGIAALLYWLAPARLRGLCLLAACYAFYCFGEPRHALVLFGATAVAFVAARRVAATTDERAKTRLVAVAVALLLGALAAFKYAGAAGRAVGLRGVLDLAAPLGISYFTFKLISYVVEVYWGRLEPRRAFADVARYAAFFPQIVSGPIQRPGDYFVQQDAQLAAATPDAAMLTTGLRLMLFGFFKKLVVADRAAIIVDQVYSAPHAHTTIVVWLAVYLFPIQLYADFSGVTDIAIGAGCLFGVRGPPNFALPYYAPNIQEFWRRWHISLSSWLGDYLFTPLRMELRDWGDAGLVVAITVNMLAVGIWHGPSWTYAAFGAINAVYMAVSALTLRRRNKWFAKRPRLAAARRVFGPLVVFHMMVLAFIPFRADTVRDAAHVFARFLQGFVAVPAYALARLTHRAPGSLWGPLAGWTREHAAVLVLGVVAMEIGHWIQAHHEEARLAGLARRRPLRWAAYYALALAILTFARSDSQSFIYFKF